MFLIFGIIILAELILITLYQFVFRKFHRIFGYVVLFAVSIALVISMFMHLVITGIIVLSTGLFLIKIAEMRKAKSSAK